MIETSQPPGHKRKSRVSRFSSFFNSCRSEDDADDLVLRPDLNVPKKRKRSDSSTDFEDKISSFVSSPNFREKDKFVNSQDIPEFVSSRSSPQQVFRLSSRSYPGTSTNVAEPDNIFYTVGSLLSTFLHIRRENFDPLFFSFPASLSEEIAERQKEISSDWPLLVIPSPITSTEDRELFERSVVQAQISNASQIQGLRCCSTMRGQTLDSQGLRVC
jgi:hypothetical protein